MGWRFVLLLLTLCFASGCSTKFVYNNLDRFARWGVSDYVQMTPAQRQQFDAEFAKLHEWHRKTQLPEYADFLVSVPRTLDAGADSSELLMMEQTVQRWVAAMLDKGLPMTAQLLRSLSDDQLAELPERLEASNQEIAAPERGGDLRDAQARWAEEVADAFKRFAGRMTPTQVRYVEARSVDYIPELEMWAEYRARWQSDLLALLRGRDRQVEFDQRFFALARNREHYYGTELSGIFAHNEALSRELAHWLLNHLSAGQRRRLDERLLELAADFRELAGVGAEASILE